MSAPVFCAAHVLEAWDEAKPQAAFVELARTKNPARADGTLVVAGREELAEFLRHPAVRATDGVHNNLGAERPLIPLDLDGEKHRKYRRLLDPLFTPKRVVVLEQAIRDRARALLDAIDVTTGADLMATFCLPLPTQVFIDLLGLPLSDLPAFLDFREAVVRPVGATVEQQRENMQAAGRRMSDYLENVLTERRSGPPRDDLIDGFLRTEIDGERLTDTEILDICYLLVVAGLDTVSSSLACFLAWFAEHPVERAAIIAHPALLPKAIEELLRFESPVPVAHRWVTEDITIDGRTFPAGSMVEVVWASANVDPAVFADSLTVDFSRTRNGHVAFAAGPHRCLGSNLARLELRVALEEFHRRFPDYRVAPDQAIAYTNYGVRAAVHLPVVFGPAPPP